MIEALLKITLNSLTLNNHIHVVLDLKLKVLDLQFKFHSLFAGKSNCSSILPVSYREYADVPPKYVDKKSRRGTIRNKKPLTKKMEDTDKKKDVGKAIMTRKPLNLDFSGKCEKHRTLNLQVSVKVKSTEP